MKIINVLYLIIFILKMVYQNFKACLLLFMFKYCKMNLKNWFKNIWMNYKWW